MYNNMLSSHERVTALPKCFLEIKITIYVISHRNNTKSSRNTFLKKYKDS